MDRRFKIDEEGKKNEEHLDVCHDFFYNFVFKNTYFDKFSSSYYYFLNIFIFINLIPLIIFLNIFIFINLIPLIIFFNIFIFIKLVPLIIFKNIFIFIKLVPLIIILLNIFIFINLVHHKVWTCVLV